MAVIDNPSEAFNTLRPVCVKLTQEQTLQNVEKLHSQLQQISDSVLQQLLEYVLFPLRFTLKSPGQKKDRLICAVVKCIRHILSVTCVQKWDLLNDLFNELCVLLCSPSNPGNVAPTSEELKTAVVEGLCALLHAAYGDIKFCLYEPSMLANLGFAISLLLKLAEHEKSRAVKKVSLQCLLCLTLQCHCCRETVSLTEEETRRLGNTFASFLPGISLALCKIINGDIKQGNAVIVTAMKVFYRATGLVMADTQHSDVNVKEDVPTERGRNGELVIKRTKDWLKDTASKLTILLRRVINCCSRHPHWKVRIELIELSNYLLINCHGSLAESVGILLEALVGLVSDESNQIKERCEEVLKRIAEGNLFCENREFLDILSENLHSLTTRLPRLMRTTDDMEKLSNLNLLLGYLRLLGPRIVNVLNSAAHLYCLSKALMQVLEMDVSDVKIVEERTSHVNGESEVTFETQTQKKYFKYFTSNVIFERIQQICRILGYYGNLYLLVDHFMDLYRKSVVYRKQAAMVINELIAGAAKMNVDVLQEQHNLLPQEDLKALVTSVTEEYTCSANWHISTSSQSPGEEKNERQNHQRMLCISETAQTSTSLSSSSILSINSNIWQICIQLEGIGCFALAVGSQFKLVLISSLYPVLEKVGDEILLISQSALETMKTICKACGYPSVKDLINQNSDYLINDISLNLQRFTQHLDTPRVLAAMIRNSDVSLLPLLSDIIQDVLLTLDLSYDERAPIFCMVLHSVVGALATWFPTASTSSDQSRGTGGDSTVSEKTDLAEEVKGFFLEYQNLKEVAEGNFTDTNEDKDQESPQDDSVCDLEEDSYNGKAVVPCHITIAKDVMERCIHLLSDKRLLVRLKALDILQLCVRVLCGFDNELLPMAHRVWPSLVQRLTNDDPLVVLRAFKVLCTLCEICKDFLKRRVSKEVLPKMTGSLMKQAAVSAKAGPIYTHTLAYKLQLSVLQGLGALACRLDLVDGDIDVILEACLPYLSCRQPLKLQEASISVFQHLIKTDPDAVWLSLTEVFCPYSYSPQRSTFHDIQLSGMGKSRDEFSDNIVKLLSQIVN
ncbi:TELO2-interacting protein 1 homolog isoform X2 [Polypterus senegalus]|uniref:TELO2-interacting protein 1 homolog isoform X2 n=1 Tax=Polypterus senegalus TaxID=55291 RepID=UPI0019650614|nr:TELO2-interacting protein 1 homolog isoform X2 [Polypterus senegalus]